MAEPTPRWKNYGFNSEAEYLAWIGEYGTPEKATAGRHQEYLAEQGKLSNRTRQEQQRSEDRKLYPGETPAGARSIKGKALRPGGSAENREVPRLFGDAANPQDADMLRANSMISGTVSAGMDAWSRLSKNSKDANPTDIKMLGIMIDQGLGTDLEGKERERAKAILQLYGYGGVGNATQGMIPR